jgi:hypothetical protein
VVIDVIAAPQAAILVSVSGPAVDETGIAQGFSGSPVKCADPADGVAKIIGAVAEGSGDYGYKVVLVTPIQEMLGQSAGPLASGASAARIGGAHPLTVSGLSRGLARRLTSAGAKAGRPILAAPAMPPAGARSLMLQDAYVYTVVAKPSLGGGAGTSYKLAAAGHTLGTISSDTSAAVSGRLGRPPVTIPVRTLMENEDTGEPSTLAAQVADETDIGAPPAGSALSFVAPLALAQGASKILGSARGMIGTVCVRIALRERRRPLRFCNRYASAAPSDSGVTIVAAGGASDALRALNQVDGYKRHALHVTEFAARVKLRRGLRQAFIRSVEMPRRVRRGRLARVQLHLQLVRGPHIARSFRLRIPHSMRPGPAAPLLPRAGRRRLHRVRPVRHAGGNDPARRQRREAVSGRSRPRSLESLARRVRAVGRYDGVTVRAGGHTARAYRDAGLRISGRGSAIVRVRR